MKNITKVLSPFLWAVGLSWRTNKRIFAFTSLSTFLTNSVSGIITTYLLAQVTASVALLATGSVTVRTPVVWALLFGAVTILFDVIRRITYYYDRKFSEQVNIYVSTLYSSKVSSFTQEQLDNPNLQTSLSMASRELYTVQGAADTLQNIASSIAAYILAVVVVWQYAWGIAVLLFVLIPILAVSNYYQTKRSRKSWEESTIHWRISWGLFNYITDPLRLFEIRIMGARDSILKLREKHLRKEMDIEMQAVRKNAFFSLFEDISSPLIEVGTRIWAILLVAGGKLAFDQFLFVIGLIQQASSQTFILGYNISRAQETYLATAALKDVMDIPDAPDGTEKIQIGGGGIAIELRDISLKYQNGTQALKNVTLSISAGQKVAIVGENGAGKTSLLRIIAKQYEPTEGTLIINGIATKQLSRESLYKHTSVLSQDYYLFDDLTIKQNLEVVAGRTLTKDDILAALDVVHLKQKILSLPHQLDTRLDKSYKDGADLSGGQRQRLSIARTLLKPFDLLILDEPTSAIDAKAERSIFNSIFEKSASATVLIVSNRFATVRKADYIYVVDDGHIIEQGTHKELMAQNGHYAELYTIQAQDFMD